MQIHERTATICTSVGGSQSRNGVAGKSSGKLGVKKFYIPTQKLSFHRHHECLCHIIGHTLSAVVGAGVVQIDGDIARALYGTRWQNMLSKSKQIVAGNM